LRSSGRLNWEAAPNRLSERLARRRQAGLEVLDLTVSNPAQAGITHNEGIVEALLDPASLRYEPSPRGLECARSAIAESLGLGEIDNLFLTASTSEAYSWLFKLLCDPGDEVLVPRPSYPLFEYLAKLESVRVREYSLRYDEGWWLPPGEVEQHLTVRTKAVVVVNPNNPTGSFLKHAEAGRLTQFCAERGIAVISDEVFADYRLSCSPDLVTTLRNAGNALTFSLGGLSKSMGLPQMKLGWIVVSGPAEDRQAACRRLELIGDTYLSVSAPVQHATRRWLAARGPFLEKMMDRLRTNLEYLEATDRPLHVEGGWYAVLGLPPTRPEEDWVLEFLERGVLTQPGYFYDFESEGWVILSLITEPGIFRQGVARLRYSVRNP
jgi:aspartate/methionine/tyrosine aminotransferase